MLLLWMAWKQYKKESIKGVITLVLLAVIVAVYSPVKLTETSYQHIENTFEKERSPLPERVTVERESFKDSVEKDLKEYQDKREGGNNE